MNENILLRTDFPDLKLFRRGKVRDVYDLQDKLLIVSTDRISCFDVVLNEGIPHKGRILTALSFFWFDFVKDITRHHLITADIAAYPAQLQKYSTQLNGRSMLVKKTRSLPVECIVRGYISGSGWKEYKERQSVCGISLPAGLRESDRLPDVLFTPSTKADAGHDLNVSQKYVEDLIGVEIAGKVKELSISIYKKARDYAIAKGIIIADTKFEFGIYDGQVMLIDEILTPDSSRFWPANEYEPGRAQASFDKQFVRDYLEGLNWDKRIPAPHLPEEIIAKTSLKYLEAYKIITGKNLAVSS